MKKEKRTYFRNLRDSVSEKDKLDNLIAESFLASDYYKNAEVLLLYASAGSEVSTDLIFRKAVSDGKKTAFPRCIDKSGTMEFFFVADEDELIAGMYNIRSPKEGCEKFLFAENAVCIVPGLSFDLSGYRLGYGKGYYDRYLEKFNGSSVGLCYEALVSESLPVGVYDRKVDCLITDSKTYKF